MTHMLLPAMLDRGVGGVVVVSSGSSTQISPQMTVYSATTVSLPWLIIVPMCTYVNKNMIQLLVFPAETIEILA